MMSLNYCHSPIPGLRMQQETRMKAMTYGNKPEDDQKKKNQFKSMMAIMDVSFMFA